MQYEFMAVTCDDHISLQTTDDEKLACRQVQLKARI